MITTHISYDTIRLFITSPRVFSLHYFSLNFSLLCVVCLFFDVYVKVGKLRIRRVAQTSDKFIGAAARTPLVSKNNNNNNNVAALVMYEYVLHVFPCNSSVSRQSEVDMSVLLLLLLFPCCCCCPPLSVVCGADIDASNDRRHRLPDMNGYAGYANKFVEGLPNPFPCCFLGCLMWFRYILARHCLSHLSF